MASAAKLSNLYEEEIHLFFHLIKTQASSQ
jgi:hypothetical protein